LPAKKKIKVRMYNVGFGDCFLISIPTEKGDRRILVDCGYHSQGKGKYSDKDLVKQIKADLGNATLNIVIATHRHQDHISGFGEQELWDDIAVEEVWLPFTADETTSQEEPALRAWHTLMQEAHDLVDENGNLTPSAMSAMDAHNPAEKAAAEFMLWNARSNAPGIDTLLHGLKRVDGRKAKRRFLPEKKEGFPSKFVTSALPGVNVHVLGPPRDPQFRKQLKVPPSWGVRETAPGVGSETGSPFSEEWRVPTQRLPSRRPFLDSSLKTIRLFNDDLLHAAKALDGFLNGESLVIVLEVGNARLLLTGDAEVGTWTTILNNPDALALAASATFLKVGHHGSHNATPLVFLKEHLAKNTSAVVSTQEGSGSYRNGIPLKGLLSIMTTRKMPFIRSDKPGKPQRGLFTVEPEGRWIDCLIPC
jgi:beta-lactamase superfamily II metal-dependent hydrolase